MNTMTKTATSALIETITSPAPDVRDRSFFALCAADDLANSGHQHVHRRDGLAVVIQAHIERLDLARVVEHGSRGFKVLFGEEALVLRLQVQPILDRELELLAGLRENFHRLRVRHPHKRPLDDELQPLVHPLVHELGK